MLWQPPGGLQVCLKLALLGGGHMDQHLASLLSCSVLNLPRCRQASNGADIA